MHISISTHAIPELRQHFHDGVHYRLPAPEGVGRNLPVLATHIIDVGELELRHRQPFGDRRGVDVLDHPRRLLVAEVLQVGKVLDDLCDVLLINERVEHVEPEQVRRAPVGIGLLLGDKIREAPASNVPIVRNVEVLEGVAVAADRQHHFVVDDR